MLRARMCTSCQFLQGILEGVILYCFLQRKAGRDEMLPFFEKPLGFLSFYIKIITNTKVLIGFRPARAHVHFVSFFARDS